MECSIQAASNVGSNSYAAKDFLKYNLDVEPTVSKNVLKVFKNNTLIGRMLTFGENPIKAWWNSNKCLAAELATWSKNFGDVNVIGRQLTKNESVFEAQINAHKAINDVAVNTDVPREKYLGYPHSIMEE